MKLIEKITGLFSSKYIISEINENNSFVECRYELDSLHKPNGDELKRAIDLFPDRDCVNITCDIDASDESVLKYKDEANILLFLKDLDSKLSLVDGGDKFILIIKLIKGRDKGEFSVYSLESFVSFWSKDGIIRSFEKIQEITKDIRVMRVCGLSSEFETDYLKFTPFDSSIKHPVSIERSKLYLKRDKVGHFSNASQFNFTPEEFSFNTVPECKELALLFNKLKLVSSLVYLCDYSMFKPDGDIHFRLNGYRLFAKEITCDFEVDSGSSNEYFYIYKWVFSEGDIIDKIGLARNIISLHLGQNDLLKLQENTLQSICSGYQIYLKDNVKQYIEIKNKLSEFIQNSSDKASEITKNVGKYYKNSIWTMYSFFVSVFVIKLVAKKTDGSLVTDDIFFLFIGFYIITLVVMWFALKEMDEDKARFKESYTSLKERYSDLILPEDLLKILNNDKQYNSDLRYIDRKKSDYRKLWAGSLSIMFVVISLLWIAGK